MGDGEKNESLSVQPTLNFLHIRPPIIAGTRWLLLIRVVHEPPRSSRADRRWHRRERRLVSGILFMREALYFQRYRRPICHYTHCPGVI